MEFEVDLRLLKQHADNYQSVVFEVLKREINKISSQHSVLLKYEILNEFAKENISEKFNCSDIIDAYVDGLEYNADDRKIYNPVLDDPFYSDILSLRQCLKYIEYGVKNNNYIKVPTVTRGIDAANKKVKELDNFIKSLKRE